MALTHVPQTRVWTRQPQFPVGINWANPLTRGLVAAYIPAGAASANRNTHSKNKTLSGAAYSNATYIADAGIFPSNSFFVLANLTGTTADAVAIGRIRYSSPSGGACLRFYNATLEVDSPSGGNWTYIFTSSVVATGLNSYAGAVSGAYGALYKNGQSVGVATTTLAAAYATPLDDGIDIGFNTYPSSGAILGQVQGVIYAGAHWNRVLSDMEMYLVNKNPWQLFAPANDGIWLPSSAALFPTLSSPRMTGITAHGGVPTVDYTF